MKKSIAFNGKDVDCYTIQLCSYGETGDFEFIPSEPLNIEFKNVIEFMRNEVQRFRSASENFLMFEIGETEITFYQSGRMILENVKPAKNEAAMAVSEKILKIIEVNDKEKAKLKT